MITGGGINDQSVSSTRSSKNTKVIRKKANMEQMIVPDSGFDCSRHAQDKAGADLLKIMLVPMLRNRPTPSQILAFMGTLGLRHTPSPVEMSAGKEEQFAQARLEIEALKYELAESRKREVDANARAD